MIFKTTLKDINAIAVAIDKLNTVRSTNVKDYTLYGAAIEGLNAKQLALALSTQKLSEEELSKIIVENELIKKYGAEELIKSGLISANSSLLVSEKSVNAEDIQKLLIKKGVNEEEAKEFIQKQLIVAANGEETASTIVLSKALMDEAVERGILTEEKATEILSTYGVVTADVAEIGSKKSLAKATKELIASKIALSKADVAMLAGVAALIFTIYKCNKAVEEAREKAQELGSSFIEASSGIDDYKSKIEELQNTIHDSNSSIEDVTNARKSLLSIQDELIDKFGTEQSVIYNVTKSINGQTEALDKLTQAKWQEIKNEFNDGGFWNDVANFFQGQDNIERLLNEYGEKTIAIKWADFADINKLTDEMIAKLENIGIDIKANTDNLQGIRDFDSLTESISDTKGASLSITGNAEEIYNQLLSLQELIRNDDSLDKLYDKVENTTTSYKELTDSYKDFYNQYILYEKILTDDSDYTDKFKDITDVYEEYNDAFTSGDEGKIKETAEKYAETLTGAMATAIANGDSDVATYFESMYPTLKSTVDAWKFNVAFDANTDDLQSEVQSVLDELKDENGRALTTEEILGLGEANEQYQALISIAHSYNMSIAEMVKLLKERNLVSAMDHQGLVGLFGQKNVDKLSPDDLKIAYTIENVGNMTFEQLQAEIQRLKDTADETDISISDVFSLKDAENNATALSNLSDQLSSVESAYNTCLAAKEEYDEQGYLSVDTLQKVLSLGDEYLQYLFDEEGNVRLDADAFQQLTQARINNMEAQALSNLAENIKQITDEATATEYLTQKQNALASSYVDVAANALLALTTVDGFADSRALQGAYNSFKTQYEQIKSLFANTRKGLSSTYTGKSDSKSSATKAAEDATKKAKDYIEAYMKFQQESLKSGRIDYNTYCNTVSNLLKSMYKDGKISAQDYWDYVGQMLEMQLDVYKKALSAVLRRYDKEIQKINDVIDGIEKQNDALEKQKSLMESAADAVTDYIDSLIDGENKSIDSLNEANEAIQDQIAKYDSLSSVADRLYEKEQENLKAQKEAIQSSIDSLNDENDALDLQYRKEQALIALRRAQTQRTKKVFNGTEFVYTTDQNAIRDAHKNLQDIKTEELISSLEKEQQALDVSIDALQKYRDAISEISKAYDILEDERAVIELIGDDYEDIILGTNIDDWLLLKDKYIEANDQMADNDNLIKSHEEKIKIWESEKKNWASLSDVIDKETRNQNATIAFGADWQEQINEGRLKNFDAFKTEYLEIQSQINDNTQLIESYNQKIEYYEALKEQWSSISDAYEQSVEDQYAAMLLGQNWESQVLSGRIDTLNNFKSEYIAIQQALADAAWESANEQIKAAQEAAKGAGGSTGSSSKPQYEVVYEDGAVSVKNEDGSVKIFDNKDEAQAYADKLSEGIPENEPSYYVYTKKYASGTTNAQKGVHLVSEKEHGDEIIVRNDKSAVLAKGEQLYPFEGGEKVLKASETEKILCNTGNLIPMEGITFGKGKNAVHFTQEEWMNKLQSVMPSFSSMVQIPKFQMPKGDFVTNRSETTPVVQNITLTLPNVTNNSGYERIQKELKQMQIDAYQFAHRK